MGKECMKLLADHLPPRLNPDVLHRHRGGYPGHSYSLKSPNSLRSSSIVFSLDLWSSSVETILLRTAAT